MTQITAAQQRVLDFVRQSIQTNGIPPTRKEIAIAMGYSSPNAAEELLQYLEKAGSVKLMRGIARGIKVL